MGLGSHSNLGQLLGARDAQHVPSVNNASLLRRSSGAEVHYHLTTGESHHAKNVGF
jgi:hypothetical protein